MAPLASVATEVIGKNDERLDLVAYDERDSERVLIEVKFWAGLTDKQPEEYLKRLPRDGDPAVLLFVAPEQRLVTLWAEICRQAEEADWDLGTDAGIEGLRSVTVVGGPRRLMLTSWRSAGQQPSPPRGSFPEMPHRSSRCPCTPAGSAHTHPPGAAGESATPTDRTVTDRMDALASNCWDPNTRTVGKRTRPPNTYRLTPATCPPTTQPVKPPKPPLANWTGRSLHAASTVASPRAPSTRSTNGEQATTAGA